MQIALFMSTALYAVGAAMYIAAAIVFSKNNLYEYFLLMRGIAAKRRHEEKEAVPKTQSTSEKERTESEENSGTDTEKTTRQESGLTGVLDGSDETSILNKSTARRDVKETQNRIWGKPTKRFKVTASEVVIHTSEVTK